MNLKSAYYAAGAAVAGVQRHRPLGRSIYSEDWDICIVLDSARADSFERALSPPRAVRREWSVGSITTEWLTNTFSARHASEVADTTLVSATPHTQTVFGDREWLTDQSAAPVAYPESPAVELDDFEAAYELWRSHTGMHNVVEPATMRDATIGAFERHGSGVVAHWMQPHEPFIAPDANILGGDATEGRNLWRAAETGEVDPVQLRQSYRANLAYAISYVQDVLERVDARVLITADHGNAFGEWGVWGHPFAWPQPAVRKVPWVTIDAEATETHEPTSVLDEAADRKKTDVDEQLRALGYR